MTKNNKYKLTDLNNYNNYLTCNLKEIIDNYLHIILNYILLFQQKNNINNNIKFFIFKKGLSMINYIFLFTLYYTKNLEVTFYHSQNSYIFYIEFIEQLNITSSLNSVKINVNDAIIFVYKKNIFDIINTVNNNSEQDKQIYKRVEELIKIYSEIIDIFINSDNVDLIELKNIIDNVQFSISSKINMASKNENIIKIIYIFLNSLFIFNMNNSQKKNMLFLFLDEITSKKNINFTSLENNIKLIDIHAENENISDTIHSLFI